MMGRQFISAQPRIVIGALLMMPFLGWSEDASIWVPAPPLPMTPTDERGEELLGRAQFLRARHAPELSLAGNLMRNDYDDVRSIGVALSVPVADGHRPALEVWRRDYHDSISDEALTRGEGRWAWQPNPDALRWLQAGIAHGEATYPTVSGGAQQALGGGRSCIVRAGYDQPWDDTTNTIRNDGRVASTAADLNLPAGRFAVVLSGRVGWYTMNGATPAGDSAGRSQEVVARGEWTVRHRSARNESLGFRDEHQLFDDIPRQDVVLFAALRRHRHMDPSSLIPVIESAAEQRIGLFAGQDLGPYGNLSLDAGVGADRERELNFGDVYGVHVRWQVAHARRGRWWIAVGRDSEGGSTVPVGITSSFAAGLNWRW